ncbi:MAG: 16S rRNA (uracil(1498)-N(3))-methyltransferase [Gammaproteobacteria bacterium RIFCSPHIGHO2_12_FULL_35_23]|nr:MAG: 16S rRNA (uracil(1498)-N(3))-methyltransferase [Gammaproteobacteria bacterium RIFCSPHIGHO2_12_FULL_35_23]
MRINRVYCSDNLSVNTEVILTGPAALHVTKVLRLAPNSLLVLFNGDSYDYEGTINKIAKSTVSIQLQQKIKLTNESSLYLHLGQAISHSNKMDIAIQKAVELGVNEITPIISEFCEIKLSKERWENKLSHWQKIIISACEQSGRAKLPLLNQPIQFADWVSARNEALKLILHPYHATKLLAKEISTTALLIGPEGGFSNPEVDFAVKQGFQAIQLGPRILRTETATIAAITLVQCQLGDF